MTDRKDINTICRAGMLALLLTTGASKAGAAVASTAEPTDSVVSITAEINASGHVQVHEPAELTKRLSRSVATPSEADPTQQDATEEASVIPVRKTASSVRAGYRIQVFDDNNPRTARQTASSIKAKIESTFPSYRAYVSFNSPYWRVKAGDFRSRAEAESAMAEIRRAFPELKAYIRIVRDRINIYD